MLAIEAGPVELIRQDSKNSYDRVTMCLMSDFSISERHYNKRGDMIGQSVFPIVGSKPDIEKGIETLQSKV